MQNQLNPQLETMFLICNSPWDDKQKELMKTELEKCGLASQDFYPRFFQPIEKYYHLFTVNMVSCPGVEFLREIEEVVLSVCVAVFMEHPEWFTDLPSISDHAASDCVRQMILADTENEYEDLFAALEDTPELPEQTKWKLLALERKAKETLFMIAEAVNLNLPAYQIAAARIEDKLQILLQQFEQSMASTDKIGLLRLPEQMNPEAVIIPTLALPMAVLIVNQVCFCGLLCNKISKGAAMQITKEELMVGAKALSDKSKVEILLCLQSDSRYSLEIAELVGLTPATVSHHMNMLLAAGFVAFERRDGKVFYKLAEDAVKRYFAGGRQLLLASEEEMMSEKL